MTAPVGGTPRDPGLQPERTRLAWRRTTLAFAVAALLAGREAVLHGGSPAGLLGLSLCASAWLAFTVAAQRRIAALGSARPAAMTAGTAARAVLCVLVPAVAGALLVFLGPR
ncbi:DUF202 domain-containing protein [Actinacidiphila glaucinigra]|uniref:DUF202 domain-containing protein n=1 Tax=Actinacidiphila glaucinigra TaxID=235986 RepID=UPI002DD9A229|nr:DUF202 domain-containing protein [Actinacidiphila glaucinigra]WSD63000.1 DUF202 domain-containing protein [Actinacidiphila glaucinigra]